MLDRRTFLNNTFLSSAGLIILPQLSFSDQQEPGFISDSELEKDFLNPPVSAKPQAFWMWMNGHITKKGITLDMQCMKKIGLAGAFIYNTGTGIPKGPVDYGSRQWDDMVIHAMAEANRLGLELLMHNSPGFSSTGGPWVSPEMSMQQLVWSETMVKSDGTIDVQLPQPYKKLGYYNDAFVIACPALKVEKALMKDRLLRLSINNEEIDKKNIQPDQVSFFDLNGTNDQPAIVLFEFAEPFEARAITLKRQREEFITVFEGSFDNPPAFFVRKLR